MFRLSYFFNNLNNPNKWTNTTSLGIGYKFALLEAMMLICTFLKSYEFKLENDETIDPVLPKKGIVNVPGDNMRIRVFHRTK